MNKLQFDLLTRRVCLLQAASYQCQLMDCNNAVMTINYKPQSTGMTTIPCEKIGVFEQILCIAGRYQYRFDTFSYKHLE